MMQEHTKVTNVQIVTEVSILSCINDLLAYRDKMRAEGPNHYPYIIGMALIQDRIDTEVTICILSQSQYQKGSI